VGFFGDVEKGMRYGCGFWLVTILLFFLLMGLGFLGLAGWLSRLYEAM